MSFETQRHTLSAFDAGLDQLHALIASMGAAAARAVETSMTAIATGDTALAQRVIEEDAALDAVQLEVERLIVTTMALHAPKADDLRMLVAALRIVAVLERIGDYAKNIARRAETVAGARLPDLKPIVAGMGRNAGAMVRSAVGAFLERDAQAALAVAAADDQVDAAWAELKRALTAEMAARSRRAPAALDLLLVGQHLERIGDHATNVAEAVYLMVTGERMSQAGLHAAA